MLHRKGIILAGGSGTRLYPVTSGISKQLLPVFDKPMIYYPLSVLMLAGIREIAVITTSHDQPQFKRLLGDGSQWGIELEYIVQDSPDGLSEAFILAESFLNGHPSALALGDNIFFGQGFTALLSQANNQIEGATVFGYQVSDPERFGVVGFDDHGKVQSITEKPESPASQFAVTGLYFVDSEAPDRAKTIQKSDRGELEITALLETYLNEEKLNALFMRRGYAWFDTGTHESLLEASNFVRTVQDRTGVIIACPEEIALNHKWIDEEAILEVYGKYKNSLYAQQLVKLLN